MRSLKDYFIGGVVSVGLGLGAIGCAQKTSSTIVKPEQRHESRSDLSIRQTGFDWGYKEIRFRRTEEGGKEIFEIELQQGIDTIIYRDGNSNKSADGYVDKIYYSIYDSSMPFGGDAILSKEKDFEQHMSEFDLGSRLMKLAKIRFGHIIGLRAVDEFQENERRFKRDPSIKSIRFEDKHHFYSYFRR